MGLRLYQLTSRGKSRAREISPERIAILDYLHGTPPHTATVEELRVAADSNAPVAIKGLVRKGYVEEVTDVTFG